MIVVTLTDAQMDDVQAVAHTVMARYQAGVVTSMRFKRPSLDRFVASFGAELAVATYLGKPWGHGDARKADVGTDIEVRWSSEHPPRLHVYDPEAATSQDRGKLDRTYVLVSGQPPVFTIHGWATGRAAWKRGRPNRNRDGVLSFVLNASSLTPFGAHLHAYRRATEESSRWICDSCDVPYVGAVPGGWQA